MFLINFDAKQMHQTKYKGSQSKDEDREKKTVSNLDFNIGWMLGSQVSFPILPTDVLRSLR